MEPVEIKVEPVEIKVEVSTVLDSLKLNNQ